MINLTRKLDQLRLLGLPIWEFSWRSLPRRYGITFLWQIALRYPLRTLKAIVDYQRYYRPETQAHQTIPLLHQSETQWRQELIASPGRWLVALGYCQKPQGEQGSICPAGFFNHRCSWLENLDLCSPPKKIPPPCQQCDIRVIGTAALQAGATVYIMTSAIDIARHLFLPALRYGRFQHALFLQCAYSIPAMILPLLICKIQSVLVSYSGGDCDDYATFLLADEGTKNDCTWLEPSRHNFVLELLQEVAAGQVRQKAFFRFEVDGVHLVPVSIAR